MGFLDKLKTIGSKKSDLHDEWDDFKNSILDKLKDKGLKIKLKGGDFGRKIDLLTKNINILSTPSEKGKLKFLKEMKKYDRDIDKVYKMYMGEIEENIGAYEDHDDDEIGELLNELKDRLDDVKNGLDGKVESILDIIDSDFDTAMEESDLMHKKKIKPMILLQHNIGPRLLGELTKEEKAYIEIGDVDVEIIIGDPDVLIKMDENSLEKQKATEEANFNRIADEIAVELKRLIAEYKLNPENEDVYEKEMDDIIKIKIKEGIKRAIDELSRLVDVRASYKKYKIKAAVDITLNVAGIIASVSGTVMAPITGGATVVIGMIGLFKSAVNLGKKIGKLSLEAEEMIARVYDNLNTLNERYQTASRNKVGASEMGVTLANAIGGEMFNTIKEVKSDCSQVGDKINGLEVNAGSLAKKLDALLDAQEDYRKELRKMETQVKDFTPKQAKAITKLFTALDSSYEIVSDQIGEVIKMGKRVNDGRTKHDELTKKVAILAKREPTWAKVSEVVINAAVGVAFITAGNVGGPEAYSFVGIGKDLADNIGTGLDVFGELRTIVEEVAELVE
ncbi:MAG: hypothetical protein ACI94Y_004391 [Maribacter sp.]|jgi:hypothetical protein